MIVKFEVRVLRQSRLVASRSVHAHRSWPRTRCYLFTVAQAQLTSVQRIFEYGDLPTEAFDRTDVVPAEVRAPYGAIVGGMCGCDLTGPAMREAAGLAFGGCARVPKRQHAVPPGAATGIEQAHLRHEARQPGCDRRTHWRRQGTGLGAVYELGAPRSIMTLAVLARSRAW